ncbi:YhcN/YlaJ family sporulation lipoprotein [Neobacillus dielmonensis]|uniref:YhcN/YlaJ family sporulation lipoprotein n=1 Tax=Neobacillus dielmonensis TaxID=1347369 RepID=UPI0005A601F3|nr:YhcN/YlaJ family sporulation lipoprotein [Neobacillus dielmonensis]
MNKKRWMIPFSVLMLAGAAGCANNDEAGRNNVNQGARPIGYYSNENHPNNNYEALRDNDGPMVDILDHSFGDEDQTNKQNKLQKKDENGNPYNPTKPLAKTDRNFFQRDNRFSTSDMNYHGHLNKRIGNAGVTTSPGYQEKVTDDIRNKVADVDNVRSIRSVSYGNTITVSVKLRDKSKDAETKRAIVNAVKPYADGKQVQVIIDDGTLGRDRNINNQQRQPEPNGK